MKLFETVLPQNYSKGLFEEKNMDLAAEHTDKVADVLFTGAGELLNAAKSKDRPTALVFEKIDNSVIAAFSSLRMRMPVNQETGIWFGHSTNQTFQKTH